MTTGERIKRARKKAGFTQRELADKLGVTPVVISQYENNKSNPKANTLNKIAGVLGIPDYELFYDSFGDFTDSLKGKYEQLFLPDKWEEFAKDHGIPLSKEDYLSWIYGVTGGDIKQFELLNAFEKLNEDGQTVAVERVEELTEIPKYQKETPPEEEPPEAK